MGCRYHRNGWGETFLPHPWVPNPDATNDVTLLQRELLRRTKSKELERTSQRQQWDPVALRRGDWAHPKQMLHRMI